MRKELQRKAVTLTATLLKHIRLNSILPFTEQPSTELPSPGDSDPVKNDPAAEPKRPLAASDLFSLFTADIIKKEVIFTR